MYLKCKNFAIDWEVTVITRSLIRNQPVEMLCLVWGSLHQHRSYVIPLATGPACKALTILTLGQNWQKGVDWLLWSCDNCLHPWRQTSCCSLYILLRFCEQTMNTPNRPSITNEYIWYWYSVYAVARRWHACISYCDRLKLLWVSRSQSHAPNPRTQSWRPLTSWRNSLESPLFLHLSKRLAQICSCQVCPFASHLSYTSGGGSQTVSCLLRGHLTWPILFRYGM